MFKQLMTGTGVKQLKDTLVNFSPFKGQIRVYPCPAEPRIQPCPVESFLKTLDPDQLVSFRSHLIRINTFFNTY